MAYDHARSRQRVPWPNCDAELIDQRLLGWRKPKVDDLLERG